MDMGTGTQGGSMHVKLGVAMYMFREFAPYKPVIGYVSYRLLLACHLCILPWLFYL